MCRIDVTVYLKCSHRCGFSLYTLLFEIEFFYTQKIKCLKYTILKPSIIYSLIVTLIQEREDRGHL